VTVILELPSPERDLLVPLLSETVLELMMEREEAT
jgi:hypothetical protein